MCDEINFGVSEKTGEKPVAFTFPVNAIVVWPGHRIRRCRMYLAITQNELARRLGITQPTLAKLEAGTGKTIKYADKLNEWWHSERSEVLKSLESERMLVMSL